MQFFVVFDFLIISSRKISSFTSFSLGVQGNKTLANEHLKIWLYEGNFIQAYDWTNWQSQAQIYIENPGKLKQADMADFIRLFTYHVRKDRFNSGHMAQMIDRGHIRELLLGLQAQL